MYHIPTPEELKKMRKEAKLTQDELAKLAGVGQSLIARIENRPINEWISTKDLEKRLGKKLSEEEKSKYLDPRISTINKIIKTLQKTKETKLKAIDIAIKKDRILTVSEHDTLSNAANIMSKNGISQLLVMDKDKIIGSIREKSITRLLLEKGENILDDKISDHLDEPFPEISAEATFEEIKSLFIDNDAVILISKGKLKGIITKADIIRSFQA